jgi:hypothetical protein
MSWLDLATAVAVGTAAAPLAGFVLRGIGLVVLVLVGVAVFG